MANQKLSELTQATTPLAGTEQVYVVQGGASRRTTAQAIAQTAAASYATAAQGAKADTAIQPGNAALSDAREWSADTISQAEAEAGTGTTRRAFTAQRVFQAIAAWWSASSAKTKLDGIASGATANSSDATLLSRANHTGTQSAATITGLAAVATSGAYSDLSGRPTLGTAAALDVAATGDATSGQVVKGSDSRLSDARTPTAHTQTASTISDSTAAGRALLTASDAAAQRSTLGLGSLATQSGTFSGTSSGTNTGDQTITLTGDVTGSGTGSFAATLANTAVTAGSYGSSSQVSAFTVDAKGRLTAASSVAISIAATGISDSTSAGRALLTGADAAAQRSSLGLGSAATSASTAFAASGAIGSSGLTMATARLLGRSTAETGAPEELTLPTGFDLSGGALRAPAEIGLACSDETTALTTGTAKLTFRMPYAMTLTAVRLSVTTAPTGSALVINVKEAGTTIFSTKPQIDAGTTTSASSGTTAVLSDTALADNAQITIDIDQIGSTFAGAGLKVWLIGRRA